MRKTCGAKQKHRGFGSTDSDVPMGQVGKSIFKDVFSGSGRKRGSNKKK
jgi:hypothetical protein